MTAKLSDDELMDRRVAARMERDWKAYERRQRREEAAHRLVGELCRDGKRVHYVWPPGGRYREGLYGDLINFLIRNNYA